MDKNLELQMKISDKIIYVLENSEGMSRGDIQGVAEATALSIINLVKISTAKKYD